MSLWTEVREADRAGLRPVGQASLDWGGAAPHGAGGILHVPNLTVRRVGRGEGCGERVSRWYVCRRDGERKQIFERCKDERDCPQCVKEWAATEASKADWRLEWVQVSRRKLTRLRRPRCMTLSWDGEDPSGARTSGELTIAFRKAYQALSRMGLKGAALVYHPERHTKGGGPVIWYEGPHFHAVGYGWVDHDKRPEGAFVKTYVPRRRDGSVASVREHMSYLLDHCGIVTRGHAVHWFGLMSSQSCVGIPRVPKSGPPICPKCGGPMEPEEPGPWDMDSRITDRTGPRHYWR